nr:DNA gyrase C-terminal beta-propeller domain-containing protein [Mycoplasmopsis bovis]
MITTSGFTIRIPIKDINQTGRATKGVKLINLKKKEQIQAVEIVKLENDSSIDETVDDEKFIDDIKNQTKEILLDKGDINEETSEIDID